MTDTRKEIAAKVGNVAAKLIERRAHLHAGFGIVECLDYATDEVNKSSPDRDIPSEIAFTRDLFFEDAKAQGLSEREAGIRWGELKSATTLVLTGDCDFSGQVNAREIGFAPQ